MAARPASIPTITLFSGIGGVEVGLSLLGAFETVCYVEREISCAAVLVQRMQEGELSEAPVWSDARTFDGRPWRGKVRVLAGSPPCQSVSVCGKKRGEEDERWLWGETIRITGEVRPDYFFFENVPGLIAPKLLQSFGQILEGFEGLGYEVKAGLFSAEEVGATHRRERIFLIGRLADAEPLDLRGLDSVIRAGDRADVVHASLLTEREPEHETGPLARNDSWTLSGRGRHTVEDTSDLGRGNATGQAQDEGRQAAQARPAHVSPDGRWRGEPDAEPPVADDYLGLFPPGPGPECYEEWDRILARRPELRPALPESVIRGLVDGSATRLDILRQYGNGVVPLCVAYAFVSLYSAFEGL